MTASNTTQTLRGFDGTAVFQGMDLWTMPIAASFRDAPARPGRYGPDPREGYKARASALLGRRQVVRHRFLVPAFAGSNPAAPASSSGRELLELFAHFEPARFRFLQIRGELCAATAKLGHWQRR